ncbi:phosphate/phosphite/phosphonate ABC transporter substrate-binding protein [Sporomusa sp. KB1]|jgi:phosphonate transport system substrate-binding protein|uniref:phosphate/phosphite/phosphonate ABC transporter substrate-binding protein n=1 Tax=Sporomusa sp. KB1 TaxID=943346 RepID=UPI0011A8DE75|nr:phosphate/phosphite/phosphonate ABC transporter substrate-binding protein [Sporomusa sp. KB1]TWH47232.1 phosphonate transport system substrate-binding protein [Sporomusa sp. KB1]
MRRLLILAISLLLVIVLVGCGKGEAPQAADPGKSQAPLRVGLVPNQAPDKIKAQYEPFREYLQKTLARPVELFVASDYAGVVEAMANDKLDVAYFGGLTYVQAKQRAKIHPIVTEVDVETGTTKYYSLIIAPVDSPIKEVKDIKGKTFAFGDIGSTSGSLYPRFMLDKAGIKVPDDLKNVVYTGGHDATAQAVQNATVDAGGIEGRIMNKLIAKGTVDGSKIKVLEKHLVEGYPWVVRDSLDKGLEEKIVKAFLDINDPTLLDLMRAKSFAKVTDANYAEAEQEAKRLGLLNPKK